MLVYVEIIASLCMCSVSFSYFNALTQNENDFLRKLADLTSVKSSIVVIG